MNNFEGKVYRGIGCTVEEFLQFKQVMEEKDIDKRVISVPLSLWSSSKNLAVS